MSLTLASPLLLAKLFVFLLGEELGKRGLVKCSYSSEPTPNGDLKTACVSLSVPQLCEDIRTLELECCGPAVERLVSLIEKGASLYDSELACVRYSLKQLESINDHHLCIDRQYDAMAAECCDPQSGLAIAIAGQFPDYRAYFSYKLIPAQVSIRSIEMLQDRELVEAGA